MRAFFTAVLLVVVIVAAYFAFEGSQQRPGELQGLGQGASSSPEEVQTDVAEAIDDHTPYPFDFSLTSTEGETVSKEDFAGRVMIVDIWGTWCPPCREEVPHFVELQDEYREQGLSVVGINYERTATAEEAIDAIANFTADIPVNYPLLLGDEATQQQVPNFEGYPTTLFIDRDGQVRLTLVGLHSKAELEAVVQYLLDEPAPTGGNL